MHSDAAHVTADQLIHVVVHIAVTHRAPVTRPPHLQPACICSIVLPAYSATIAIATAHTESLGIESVKFVRNEQSCRSDMADVFMHMHAKGGQGVMQCSEDLCCNWQGLCRGSDLKLDNPVSIHLHDCLKYMQLVRQTLTGLCLPLSISCQGAYTAASNFSTAF